MAKLLMWIGFFIALFVFPFITIPILLVFLLIKTGKATIKILPFFIIIALVGYALQTIFHNAVAGNLAIVVISILAFVYLFKRSRQQPEIRMKNNERNN
jgi:hypothetical protein